MRILEPLLEVVGVEAYVVAEAVVRMSQACAWANSHVVGYPQQSPCRLGVDERGERRRGRKDVARLRRRDEYPRQCSPVKASTSMPTPHHDPRSVRE